MHSVSLNCSGHLPLFSSPSCNGKIEGPSSSISYLGLLIDTQKGEIRIPEEKLAQLLEELVKWRGKKTCTKRELLSLIG